MGISSLLNHVRESVEKQTWSKAIELVRTFHVLSIENTGECVEVDTCEPPNRSLVRRVKLYPNDMDWTCNCNGDDPCIHVAMAAIAAKRLEDGVIVIRQERKLGKLVYKLIEKNNSLALERWVRQESGEEEAFTQSAGAIGRGDVAGNNVAIVDADIAIEKLLILNEQKILARDCVQSFVIECEQNNVELEFSGKRLLATKKTVKPVLNISRSSEVFIFQALHNINCEQVFQNNLAICDGKLVFYSGRSHGIFRKTALLEKGLRISERDLAGFISTHRTELEKAYEINDTANIWPSTIRWQPRISIDCRRINDDLSVEGFINYADDVHEVARVTVDGELKILGTEIPQRLLDKERALCDRFSRAAGFALGSKIILKGDEASGWLKKIKLEHWTVKGRDYLDFIEIGELAVQVLESSGSEVFHFSASVGGLQVSPEVVWNAWCHGQNNLSIRGTGSFRLPSAWLEKYREILTRYFAFSREKEIAGPVRTFFHEYLRNELSENCEASNVLANVSAEIVKFSITRLQAILRDYQAEGIAWLMARKQSGLGAILADDMGLGKTLQSIGVMDKNVLVIAPTTLLSNWQKEVKRFRPDLSCQVFHGAGRELIAADVIITSYGILRRDLAKLREQKWDMIVIDEAQTIKNADAQVSRSVFQLCGSFRVALSGTPIENSVEDLWSIMNFANPGLLGTLSEFKSLYSGDSGRAALKSLIGPLLMRRLKRDVAKDLPEKVESIVRVDLSPEERLLYEGTLSLARKSLDSHTPTMQILEQILRLRQICCASALFPGSGTQASAKIEYLSSRVWECLDAGYKVIVFSQWTSFLDLFAVELSKRIDGATMLRLDGSTRDRQQIVDDFQNSEKPVVLMMSLKAGGVGLNLTAADYVFLADPWWNPATEDQATDRAHRIGRVGTVFVERVVANGTIEERVLELLKDKRVVADSVLGDGFGEGIERDGLLNLLKI